MHATEDEAELRAGRIAAFTKQGQRLIEATHDKDAFARVRATENLKNWVAESQKIQEDAGRSSGEQSPGYFEYTQRGQQAAGRGADKALQSQISTNSLTTEQAKEVLKSAGGKQQEGETADDNREKLNDLYRKQVNVNGGELNLTGSNTYNGGTTVGGGALAFQNAADFNGNWITRNNLGNGALVAQPPASTNGLADAYGTSPGATYPQGGVQYSMPGGQPGLNGAGSTFSGAISGAGGLTKTGAGALTLSGSNTYSGNTLTINGGMLQSANPSLANGRIILNNEQSFGGQGNIYNANPATTNYKAMGGTNWAGIQAQSAMPNSASPFQSYALAQQANPSVPGIAVQLPQGFTRTQQPYGGRGAVRQLDQQRELAEYQQKLSVNNKSQLQSKSGDQVSQPRMGLAGSLHDAMHNAVGATPSTPSVSARPTSPLAVQPPAITMLPGEKSELSVIADSRQEVHENIVDMLEGAAPAAPAGLASLDFELPTDTNLYEIHRFTTPRGEAELTARSVSNRTLAKLEFLAGIVAASLLIWAAFWLIRRGVLNWFRRPLGAALLAIVGLAALCGSVLPILGLLALLTGIALLVMHFWRRRVAVA